MQMTLYQHHLPSEVRVFRYLSPPVRSDDEMTVCDGWYPSGPTPVCCRSYMFATRWLHVFATFGHHLALKEDSFQGFPFAFNCDITTPHHKVGNSLYTTDLCVDVLVSANGRDCLIKDEEGLAAMHAAGQFGDLWRDAALKEVLLLKELVSQRRFVDFLEAAAPFPTAPIPIETSEMTRCQLGSVNFVFHPLYPRYA